jgi:hypothetical protein
MSRRLALFALPLLLTSGCAQMSADRAAAREERAAMTPAGRFAASIEGADQTMETTVGRMYSFERLAARENAAIDFAIGSARQPQLLPPGDGVVGATGRVLSPAFTALGDYGHVLAQLAGDLPLEAEPSASGAQLAAAASQALDEVRAASGVTVSAPVREAGLRAIAVLADMPEQLAKTRRTPSLDQVVSEAQPHVAALTTMLRQLLGETQEAGVRNVIRTRRLTLDNAHGRFLTAVRNDRTAGPAERYAIFRTVAELRQDDPAQGTIQQIVALLGALADAHDALGKGAADAEAKMGVFEASVSQLAALTEQSRHAGQQ